MSTLAKQVGHASLWGYPCLQYCKGGNSSKVNCLLDAKIADVVKTATTCFLYMLLEIEVFIKRYSEL